MYSIKSKNIKSIRNYAEAKARYESIKPLRGRVSDVRPLGPRRYTYINIKHSEADCAYCVVLHQTPIITYYPSGVIKLDNGDWQTASTKAIMNEVLPVGMAITTTNPMRVRVMDKGEFAFNGTTMMFNAEGNPMDAMQEVRYTVNRKKAREVLRRYQDFLTWGKGYLSLVDNLIYDDTPTTENERQEMRAMQMMAQDIYSPYPKRWTMEDSSKVKNQQRRAFLERIDGTHNADTDLRLASTGAIRRFMAQNPKEFDPRKYLKASTDAMRDICIARYEAFGACGQASKIKAVSLDTMANLYLKGQLAQIVK